MLKQFAKAQASEWSFLKEKGETEWTLAKGVGGHCEPPCHLTPRPLLQSAVAVLSVLPPSGRSR